MSVPRTLVLPEGVAPVSLETDRGTFAGLEAKPSGSSLGHILLIPGWTGSKEDFTPILPLLAAAGFDVTTYDQRGQYETAGTPNADYTLAGFADDALSVRSRSGHSSSHVLGHSFGGLVSQQAVLSDPASWDSLSLLDSGPGALGDSPVRPLTRLIAALGKVPLLQIHEVREQGIKRPAQITRFLAHRFTSNDPASLKAMTRLLIDAPDIIDQVAELDLPVWVGRGADDDAWPNDLQAAMATRLGTTIHVIKNAAHSPAVENPDGLMEAWLPFLVQHGLAQPGPAQPGPAQPGPEAN